MTDTNPRVGGPRRPWFLTLMAVVLALLVCGYLYNRSETARIGQEKYDGIRAISEAKAAQIGHWRQQRLFDIAKIAKDPIVSKATAALLREPDNQGRVADMRERLKLEQEGDAYADALLLIPDGRILLSARDVPEPLLPATSNAVAAALKDRKAVFADPYRSPSGVIYVDVVQPMYSAEGVPLVVVVLCSDAAAFLYPLIQSWPTPSPSAETLLIQRKGDEIVFLNELRQQVNSALSLHVPLSHTDVAGVQAVLGRRGMFQGKDYRGVDVLADLRPVPGSDWFLVAKVDTAEILAEARYRATMLALLVLLAIVLAAVSTTMAYRRRQSWLFREFYEAEQQRRAIKEELRTAFYSIGDAVMTTDKQGHVRHVNPVAERLTGWTEAEAFGRPLHDVFRSVNEQTRGQVESPVDRVLREGKVVGMANHPLLIAKDGSERPIVASGAPIRADKGEISGVVLVFRDQTEERAADNTLRGNEQRLRRFYESGLLGVIFWDMHGQILEANDKFLEMVGYTRADLTSGKIDWLRMTPPEYSRDDEDSVAELKATGVNRMPFEKEYVRKDGTRIPISVAGAMLDEERINGVAFVLDITERKRAENALREQEVLYRSLFDSMLNGFAHCRMLFEHECPVDFIYLNVNGAFEAQTGLKNVTGRKVSEVIPGIRESSRDLFAVYGRVALTGHAETFETYVEALNMWFAISVYSPKREHFVAVFDVITERKRAEDALRKSEGRLSFALQTIQTGAWSLDLQDHTAERTLLHDRIFGYETPLPAWTFDMFLEHVLPEDRADVDRAFTEATTKQSDWNFECRIRRVDGELRWIRAAGRHERNAESKPVRMSGIVQDITERKSAEEGIRKLNVELEQRVRARTAELEATNAELEAFAYSVSHDLRAPLRAIAGFSRILVDDYGPQLDDEGRRVCSVIDDNARNMSQLIDDLLAFSRLGRTQMQPSLIDMQGMARAVFHEVTTPEQRSRIDFELPTIPQVIGDPSLMRQVWANLLGNAVKFSSRRERAAITIRSETKEGEYVFSIGDNGAGFDMQYVNKLFGVFQRLHSSKQFEGTGVGLALVQRVIRRHGGRVWAQGEPDRGATFHFALPLKGP